MSEMWKRGEPGQLSDYAKSIGVTEMDSGTARGCYLTAADIKHIRKMLQRIETECLGDDALDLKALQWNRDILEYTRTVR